MIKSDTTRSDTTRGMDQFIPVTAPVVGQFRRDHYGVMVHDFCKILSTGIRGCAAFRGRIREGAPPFFVALEIFAIFPLTIASCTV